MLEKVWDEFQEFFVDGFSMVPVAGVLIGYSYLLIYRPEEFLELAFFDRLIHSLAVGIFPLMILFGVFRSLYLFMDQLTVSINYALKILLNEESTRTQLYNDLESKCGGWFSRENILSDLENGPEVQINTGRSAAAILIITAFLTSFIAILTHYELTNHIELIVKLINSL